MVEARKGVPEKVLLTTHTTQQFGGYSGYYRVKPGNLLYFASF